MSSNPAYISDRALEHRASNLLREFFGHALFDCPIPVEDIVEKHLRLQLDFDDLTPRLISDEDRRLIEAATGKAPKILAATFIRDRSIFVDESLDPVEHPEMQGRYRLSVAHEIGHWELHRPSEADPAQGVLFETPEDRPLVLCRADRSRDSIERQATKFGAFLLMPKEVVLERWLQELGDLNPRTFQLSDLGGKAALESQMNDIARPFAVFFGTSVQATRIRLQEMRLLSIQAELELSWRLEDDALG